MASILVDGLRLPVAVAGHPVLELCNTRAGWLSPIPKEYLVTYPHLAVWAREAGLVDARACADALAAAATDAEAAEGVRRRAIAFRGALYAVLTGAAGTAAWDGVNTEVAAALCAARLSGVGAGSGRNAVVSGPGEPAVPAVWEMGGGDLAAPLVATAWAAAWLLTSDAATHVRACPGGGCGWLFHDPRGRRRWCSMAWCGNREKARRHATRSRPGPR